MFVISWQGDHDFEETPRLNINSERLGINLREDERLQEDERMQERMFRAKLQAEAAERQVAKCIFLKFLSQAT